MKLHKLGPVQVFGAFSAGSASPNFPNVEPLSLSECLVVIGIKFGGNKIHSMSIAGLRRNNYFIKLSLLSIGVREIFEKI